GNTTCGYTVVSELRSHDWICGTTTQCDIRTDRRDCLCSNSACVRSHIFDAWNNRGAGNNGGTDREALEHMGKKNCDEGCECVPNHDSNTARLDPLILLVYSQVILSLMIPLPMIPLVYFTSKRKFMGDFVNRRRTIIVAVITVALIMAFNVYLLLTYV